MVFGKHSVRSTVYYNFISVEVWIGQERAELSWKTKVGFKFCSSR